MILQDVLQWNHTEMGWFFRCKTTMTSTHFATQEPVMVGWSFKNTRCFDQGRYMYRFAPEVSDCFMSWSNFRAHLLNSKWGRSIVFDIGRLLKKNNTLIPHTATSRRLYLRVLPSFRHLCVLCTLYPLWILRFVFFVHAAFRAMLPSLTRVGAAMISR